MTSEEKFSADDLKGVGKAWLSAGSSLGDVVGTFTTNFRRDRQPETPTGAHAYAGDTADTRENLGGQFRSAVDKARDAFKGDNDDKNVRAAASSLAQDTNAILRDIAASASRAGNATAQSPETRQMKDAFGTAVGEVRETFNHAVADIRGRADRFGGQKEAGQGPDDIIDGVVVSERDDKPPA